MKTYTFLAILVVGFTLAITAAVKPEAITHGVETAIAPIKQFADAQDQERWKIAKEQERALWVLKMRLPTDCSSPATELRKLECKNLLDQREQQFEKEWRARIASGWKPS